jgi:hypothetical protein
MIADTDGKEKVVQDLITTFIAAIEGRLAT